MDRCANFLETSYDGFYRRGGAAEVHVLENVAYVWVAVVDPGVFCGTGEEVSVLN